MGRSPCCDKTGLKKGPWTPEEDLKLVQYVQINGPGNWRALPKNAGLQRCGKSCRLRWTNYLRPDIKRGRFSFEEEEAIIQLHSILGNKWSAIAARLPGRTDNEIKNYWNTHIRKKLLKMGIDPVTHSPRLDLLDLSKILHSTHLNLSNLLGLQTLVNPQLLSLATNLLASSSAAAQHHENPEILLQKLQENQFLNTQLQESQIPCQPSKYQIQSPVQGAPPCAAASSGVPYASILDQTQLMTGMGMGDFSTSSAELSCEDLISGGFPAMLSDQKMMDPSGKSTIQSMNNGGQNFTFDSVMSTPMSSPTPFNSSSTFVNSGSTEDERESYCSSMLKFEIPESLDFDDFM